MQMLRTLGRLLLVALATAVSIRVHADEPIDAAGPAELLISPDLSPSFGRDAQPTIEITRADIERQQPRMLSELLRRMAPLTIVRSAGGSFIHLRGAESNFTGVFVDGVPLNDPTDSRGGSVDIDRISLSEVERIEILSATEAALLAPGQLAGAINIITRSPGNSRSSAVAEAGDEYLAGRGRLTVSSGVSGAGLALDAYTLEDAPSANDRQQVTMQLNGNYVITPRIASRLMLRAGGVRQRAYPEDSGGPELAVSGERVERRQRELLALGGLEGEISHNREFLLQVSHLFLWGDEDSPVVAPGERDPFGIPATELESGFGRTLTTGRFQYTLGPATTLRAGVDASQERSSSESTIFFGDDALPADFEERRYLLGTVLEASHEVSGSLSLRAGSRYDRYEGFRSELGPFALVSQRIGGSSTIWAGYSEASKPPSIYALSHPFVGNQELQLERGRTIEGGARSAAGPLSYSVTLFRAVYSDAIDLDDGPPPLLVNRDRVTSRGADLALHVAVSESSACRASTSFARTEIADSDDELRHRPEWRASLTCAGRVSEPVEIGFSTYYTDSRYDSSVPTGRVPLAAYTQTDLFSSYRVTDSVTVRASIDNLFNDRYHELVGTRARGVFPRIGVEVVL